MADADIVATRDTDFLVIGAGNAGMMAAGTASDLGLDFIVAEKGTSVGDTREYVGAINSKYALEVADSVDEMKVLNELTRYASGRVDQRVIKTWLREGKEMIEWITPIMEANGKTLGVTPMEADHPAGGTYYFAPTIEHFFNPTYEYPMRNDILEWHIQEAGHEISYNYDLVKLDHDGNRVTGAVFATPEGLVRVNAAKGHAAGHRRLRSQPRDDPRELAARPCLLYRR
ncbi:MAG: FAD-binding protein [Adlercreutzia equolifaciens]